MNYLQVREEHELSLGKMMAGKGKLSCMGGEERRKNLGKRNKNPRIFVCDGEQCFVEGFPFCFFIWTYLLI